MNNKKQIYRCFMKNGFYLLILMQFILACGNKMRQPEPVFYNEKSIIEQSESDTVASSVHNEIPKVEEKLTIPVSSSSSPQSSKSSAYDNMRGFDPASEDDIDDNGMSRYMENNDEEGWD